MSQNGSNLYALLIGVDCYIRNELPGGGWFPSLGGCVRDIAQVERFLRGRMGLTDNQILKLTATYTGPLPGFKNHDFKPTEPPEQWPTYDNMVAKFKQLIALAKPGDQVYIHYSGHGGRAKTIYPDLKPGANALDEALVPTDIGSPGTRYLRDIELAHLLQEMVKKGLIVTVVLDSCHSGGATRGMGDVGVRGIDVIDETPRPTDSKVASDAELRATWAGLSAGGTRNAKLDSGWLLEPQGYTLLAACRAQEFAYETAFEGERHGALTYWWLKSMEQLGQGMAYQTLYNRVLAKVHSQFEAQTPQLEGDGERMVFGSDRVQPQQGIDVLDVQGDRVRIDAGHAQGLRKGAKLAVYSFGVTDLTDTERRVALVEVDDLGAGDSWAVVTKQLRQGEPIEQGSQAVLIDAANINLQRPVQFVRRPDLPATVDQEAALAAAQAALAAMETKFARPAELGESVAFQVAVNASGEYEIWDAAGNVLPNLRPALKVTDPKSAAGLAARLVHLARYRNVQELDNFDPLSPLTGKLAVELLGKQTNWQPGDQPKPIPFDDPKRPTVRDGDWVFLKVRNLLQKVVDPKRPWLNTLNVAILDLAPDWSVSQLYPSEDDAADFFSLDPDGGETPLLPIQLSIPKGQAEITDVFKVMATRSTTSFRWLELPALDRPYESKAETRGVPGDPLDELFAAMADTNPGTRTGSAAAFPNRGWTTVATEIHTKK